MSKPGHVEPSVDSDFIPPDGLTILTGPAASGKTAAALRLYRRGLDPAGRPGCLLVVPNAPTASHLRRLLLEGEPSGVLIAPALTTFAGLAAGVLAHSERPPVALSNVQRRLLLGQIVSRLNAAGKLRAIGPLADTPGLVPALDAAIAELKRAAVEPEVLAKAMGRPDAKNADLLAVYRQYQQHLVSSDRFDTEGLLWLARDALAADPSSPLGYEGIAAIAADGFTDFTPTQLEMLALLARRMRTMLITLPLSGEPSRKRLWFWTERTLARIRQAMPQARVVALTGRSEPLATLFDLAAYRGAGARAPSGGEPKQPHQFSIAVVEAPQAEAEVRAVARAIKADLLAGAAPGSIAVLARSLTEYSEPLERVFAECDIPVAPRPTALAACNIVRYILRLLSLPPEYEFHDLLAAIKSSYFRPAALGDFDGAAAATAEMAVRTANVLRGRKSYADAFARLARRIAAGRDRPPPAETDDEETIALGPLLAGADDLARAGAMLESLFGRLEKIASAKDAKGYVAGVRRLIADLQIPQAACAQASDELVAGDLRALRAFDELLNDLEAAEPPAGARADRLARWLAQAASAASCPPRRGEDLVAALDVLDARAIRFRKAYLLGANEKAFPQLAQEHCFIDQSDRAAWIARGLPLDSRSDLLGREMLLFYLAATRAAGLTVSYVTADSAGKTHTRSVFVDELAAAAAREGLPLRREVIPAGQSTSPRAELASPAEAYNAAISSAFDPDRTADAPALLGWAAGHLSETLARGAFGLLATFRRWRPGVIDAFDGRLDDPALLADLARRIPDEWVFSATELNAYAQCPWQFFARYLLHLEPLTEPTTAMTPTGRGNFCHAVLWLVFTALAGRGGGGVDLAEVEPDELKQALAQAVERERTRLAERAMYTQLWNVQTEYWQRLLWAYLGQQRARAQEERKFRAAHFELGFGLEGGDDDRKDPASRKEPVQLDVGGATIRLRGKIDRVDSVGAGRGELLAVDYKSGSIPPAKDILHGRDFQLALYAKTLEAIFRRPCAGGEYHGLRDGEVRCLSRFKVPRNPDGLSYEQLLARSMAMVSGCIEGMRLGRFDAIPAERCSKWCPYRRICHFGQARAQRKAAQPGGREGGDE